MSKEVTREQTGDFLDGAQRTSSYRSVGQDQYVFSTRKSLNGQALTGARQAILPMRIATVGRNVDKRDERIEFTMLMNPDSWNHGKTQSYQSTYTRSGWHVQLWGSNQDTISSTGRTAAMMTPEAGLDYTKRVTTFAYLNFMALVTSYKTNGYEFMDRLSTVESLTRVISRVRGVQIIFDGHIFMGHFANFTLDESAESPFVFNYNFEFIISTLTGSDFEVRGHYKQLPLPNSSTEGTAADPETLTLLSDAYEEEPTFSLTPPRPTDDRTTIKLWELKTRLPWSEAIRLGMTNGSVKDNMKLRKDLVSKKWDSNTQSFV